MDPTYKNSNLVGFDVDSGAIVSNCAITGGVLLDMAVINTSLLK